jgi:uncharacterized protein
MVSDKNVVAQGEKSKVIIEYKTAEFKENPTMILGFAGVGLLGPIIGNTFIDQIEDLKEIGFVATDMLPPIAVFYDGELKHPFRIYYTAKYNIILGISEVPFNVPSAYNDLSKTICKWANSDDVGVGEIIAFQGIPQKGMIDEFPVYYAAEQESMNKLKDLDLKKVEKGIITGAEATLVNEALTNKLRALVLFTPVYKIATPEGAASIIEILNNMYNLNIDTSKLIEEGKEIKKKMQELADKARQFQRKQISQEGKEGYTGYYQ